MRKFVMRKRVLVPMGLVAVLVVAGAAIAYFTTTGSGTGSATVGSSSAVTLHGTAATTLYPGTTSVVNFTVDNPSPVPSGWAPSTSRACPPTRLTARA